MSRSTDTQNMKRGKSIQFDFGTVTLGAAGTAIVYTQLNRVQAAFASHQSSLSSCALQIGARAAGSGAPNVTITDPAGAVSSGDTIHYGLLGW